MASTCEGDHYEDWGDTDVPDDHCPFHPERGCRPAEHFATQEPPR